MIKETLTVFSKPSHSKEFLMFSAHVGGAARQQGPRRSAEPQGAIFRRLSRNAWSAEAMLSKEDYTHCLWAFHNNRWLVQSCQTTPCIFLLLSLPECVLSRSCLWDVGGIVPRCVASRVSNSPRLCSHQFARCAHVDEFVSKPTHNLSHRELCSS